MHWVPITYSLRFSLFHTEDERVVLFIMNSLLTTFPIGVSLCMLWKSGKLRSDIYGIRDEISIQCVGFLIAFVIFLIPGAYFTFFTGHNTTEDQKRLEWLFSIPQTQITAITVAIVSTAYPVYRYKKTAATDKMVKHMNDHNRQHIPSTTADRVNTPRPSNSRQLARMTTLSNAKALKWVIADSETYQQFMDYLISEFSTEVCCHWKMRKRVSSFFLWMGMLNQIEIELNSNLIPVGLCHVDCVMSTKQNLLFLTELVQIKYHFAVKNKWLLRIPKSSIIQTPLHLKNPLTPKSKNLEEPKMTFDDQPSDHNDDERYMTIDFHDDCGEEACWTYLFQFGIISSNTTWFSFNSFVSVRLCPLICLLLILQYDFL